MWRSSGLAGIRRLAQRRRSRARSAKRPSPIDSASDSPAVARASIARRIRAASAGDFSNRRRSIRQSGHGRTSASSTSGPAQAPQVGHENAANRMRSDLIACACSATRTHDEWSRTSISVSTTVSSSPSYGQTRMRSPARRPVIGSTGATVSRSRSGQASGSDSSSRTCVGPEPSGGQSRSCAIHQSSTSRASLRARVSFAAASSRAGSPRCRSGWVCATRLRHATSTPLASVGGTTPRSHSARRHSATVYDCLRLTAAGYPSPDYSPE